MRFLYGSYSILRQVCGARLKVRGLSKIPRCLSHQVQRVMRVSIVTLSGESWYLNVETNDTVREVRRTVCKPCVRAVLGSS